MLSGPPLGGLSIVDVGAPAGDGGKTCCVAGPDPLVTVDDLETALNRADNRSGGRSALLLDQLDELAVVGSIERPGVIRRRANILKRERRRRGLTDGTEPAAGVSGVVDPRLVDPRETKRYAPGVVRKLLVDLLFRRSDHDPLTGIVSGVLVRHRGLGGRIPLLDRKTGRVHDHELAWVGIFCVGHDSPVADRSVVE